jgi:hypothetical protein
MPAVASSLEASLPQIQRLAQSKVGFGSRHWEWAPLLRACIRFIISMYYCFTPLLALPRNAISQQAEVHIEWIYLGSDDGSCMIKTELEAKMETKGQRGHEIM